MINKHSSHLYPTDRTDRQMWMDGQMWRDGQMKQVDRCNVYVSKISYTTNNIYRYYLQQQQDDTATATSLLLSTTTKYRTSKKAQETSTMTSLEPQACFFWYWMLFYLFLLRTFLDTIYNNDRMIEQHGVRKWQDNGTAGAEKGQGRRLGWWWQVLVYDNNNGGRYPLCFASISSWQGTVTRIQSQARLCCQAYQSLSCWSENLWVPHSGDVVKFYCIYVVLCIGFFFFDYS